MTVHSFDESLRKSHEQADAPWWGAVYRKAFPDFEGMHCVRKDGWAQRGGIDRVVVLTGGKVVTVDEKVRHKDYNDILLEYWSDRDRRVKGWVAKELACDFIAYAFVPSAVCYFLPTLALRRAWFEHRNHWVNVHKKVEARNAGYVTVSVAVPIDELFQAIGSALQVRWG